MYAVLYNLFRNTDQTLNNMKKLDDLGIREETIVIFTGDNGTYTGVTSRMGNVAIKGGKGKRWWLIASTLSIIFCQMQLPLDVNW